MLEFLKRIVGSVWTPLGALVLGLLIFVMYLHENNWIPRVSPRISVGVLLNRLDQKEVYAARVDDACPSCDLRFFQIDVPLAEEDESWKGLRAWWVQGRLDEAWFQRLRWLQENEYHWIMIHADATLDKRDLSSLRALRMGSVGSVDVTLTSEIPFEVAAAQIIETARPYLRMTLPMLREWVRAGSRGEAQPQSFGEYHSDWSKMGRPGFGTYRRVSNSQIVALNLREPIEEIRLDADCASGVKQESYFLESANDRYDVSLAPVWDCENWTLHLRKAGDSHYFKSMQIVGFQ